MNSSNLFSVLMLMNYWLMSTQYVILDEQTYRIIEERYQSIEVLTENEAKSHFQWYIEHQSFSEQKSKEKWKTPEICEWSKLQEEYQIPDTQDICNIVAIRISLLKPLKLWSSLIQSYFSYYHHYKLPVESTTANISKSTQLQVMVCPPIQINRFSRNSIYLNSFLIGFGDDQINSIYVFKTIGTLPEIKLSVMYYMTEVLKTDTIKIQSTEEIEKGRRNIGNRVELKFHGSKKAVRHFKRYLSIFPRSFRPRDKTTYKLCRSMEWERREICKDLAFKRFNIQNEINGYNYFSTESDAIGDSYTSDDFDDIAIDTDKFNSIEEPSDEDLSGLIPYKCVSRPFSIYKNSKIVIFRKMIYCPDQFISDTKDDMSYWQPGFLFSAEDWNKMSLFIYNISYERKEDQKMKLKSIYLSDYVTLNLKKNQSKQQSKNSNHTAIDKKQKLDILSQIASQLVQGLFSRENVGSSKEESSCNPSS